MMRNPQKLPKWILRAAMSLAFCLISIAGTQAQNQTTVSFRVIPGNSRVAIEGVGVAKTAWSFRDSYAGLLGLGARIEGFELLDEMGSPVAVRKIAPGQFESAASASRFKYEVSLNPPARSSDAALVSWLNSERGVLMLSDLLPIHEIANKRGRIRLRIEAPPGWIVHSSEKQSGQNEFEIEDPDRTVISVGRQLRSSARSIAGTKLTLVADGDWAFQDSDAIETAAKILKAHADVVDRMPCNQTVLFVLPFPLPVTGERWSAQTRGCSVLLLMGKLPSRIAALSQLGNGLTHELFHLWVPNGLALHGDYDWFYEGFTIYHAARTAVKLDLLTFPELLNALGRAYDGFATTADLNRLSLVEASKRRWTSGESVVYSKAMLIAFLYDLNLRYQSKGKRSLDDVYRDIFRAARPASQSSTDDGNTVVMAALRAGFDGQDFVRRFISEPVSIDLGRELAPFGLRVEAIGARTRVFVGDNLTRRQRDLLRQLGYNERRR